ncbi:MAG: hypothetical protein JNJ91_06300 [Flavobacteriales bacterium]|nr:hypothetical protein [Flavobacteriales bacterium]
MLNCTVIGCPYGKVCMGLAKVLVVPSPKSQR